MKNFFINMAKGDVRSWISILVILASFAFLFTMLFVKVPKENEALINVVAGAVLVGGVGSVVSYYFGSSKTSENNQNPTQ